MLYYIEIYQSSCVLNGPFTHSWFCNIIYPEIIIYLTNANLLNVDTLDYKISNNTFAYITINLRTIWIKRNC